MIVLVFVLLTVVVLGFSTVVKASSLDQSLRVNILDDQNANDHRYESSQDKTDKNSKLRQTQALAKYYRDTDAYNGVWKVLVNAAEVYEEKFGYANFENSVKMDSKKVFPIGSNTKLFTAVALYQLQEKGKVNLAGYVNDDLSKEDFKKFGFPDQTTWCPKLVNDTTCQKITYHQLLSMSSGIGDFYNCDKLPSPDTCLTDILIGEYRGSVGSYVKKFINERMIFAPGSAFSYANPNFVLAGYMIEKFSKQSLTEYWTENIFKPLGLKSTYFDPVDGYYSFTPNLANQYSKFYSKDTGNKLLGTGICGPKISAGALGSTGGILATIDDVFKYYLDLFGWKGKNSKVLTEKSITEIVKRWSPAPFIPGTLTGDFYAQGVGVHYDTADQDWPTVIEYCGDTVCAQTCLQIKYVDAKQLL